MVVILTSIVLMVLGIPGYSYKWMKTSGYRPPNLVGGMELTKPNKSKEKNSESTQAPLDLPCFCPTSPGSFCVFNGPGLWSSRRLLLILYNKQTDGFFSPTWFWWGGILTMFYHWLYDEEHMLEFACKSSIVPQARKIYWFNLFDISIEKP